MYPKVDVMRSITNNRSVAVIINPVNCACGAGQVQEKIEAILSGRGFTSRFFYTSMTYETKRLTEEALAQNPEFIIAAGGDGTIMEVINALVGRNIPLGIIPLGTGNLLAINLGIPLVMDDAITAALSDSERLIDLIKLNGGEHYFAIMGGIGFDAKIMDDTDQPTKERFGRLAYFWTAMKTFDDVLFDARIWVDGAEIAPVSVKSILIANMGFLGPNLNAFPGAEPDDGIIQIGLLKPSNAGDLVKLVASAVVAGAPPVDPAFEILSCRTVAVELTAEQPFEYDGNIVGPIKTLKAEVAPRVIRMRVPHAA